MNALRWVAVLPGAAICGYLAYVVGGSRNNLGIMWFTGPLTGEEVAEQLVRLVDQMDDHDRNGTPAARAAARATHGHR
jgi:hypothetical protein